MEVGESCERGGNGSEAGKVLTTTLTRWIQYEE